MANCLAEVLAIQLVGSVNEVNYHALSVADALPTSDTPYMIASATK